MCFCSFGPDVSEMNVSKFQIWKSDCVKLSPGLEDCSPGWIQFHGRGVGIRCSAAASCCVSFHYVSKPQHRHTQQRNNDAWQHRAVLTVTVYSPLSQTRDHHSFLLLLLYGEIIKTQTNWRNQEGGDAVFVGLLAGLYRTARHAVCARLHTNATAWLHACVCVIRSACYAASHYIHMVVPHSQFYFHVFKYGQ